MEIYQFSDTERFTYTYDEDTRLADFTGEMYFVQVLLGPHGRYSYETDTLPEINAAVLRFEESGLTDSRKSRAVELYAKALGFVGVTKTIRGYSQGEWLDVFIYCKPADVDRLPDFVEEFTKFYRGDVYNVSLEKAKVFTAADGETVIVWQNVDTLGGFVADDQEKLNEYARDAFAK
jgi:hypothetical protein